MSPHIRIRKSWIGVWLVEEHLGDRWHKQMIAFSHEAAFRSATELSHMNTIERAPQ